jgi:hypothetical protein
MKKIMLIAFSIAIVLALAAPQVVLADSVTWAEGVFNFAATEGSLTYGLSNNCYLDYAVETDYQDYAIATVHQAGNRAFTTTNNTTLIYWVTKSTGDTSVGSVPSAGATNITGWSAL